VRAFLAAAASLAALAACTDPTCSETQTVYTAAADATPPENPAVAHFEVSQLYKTYGPVGCVGQPFQPVGVVTATATSLVNEPATLTYELQGLDASGQPTWSSIGVFSSIHPGQSFDLGQVAVATKRLTGNARVVVMAFGYLPIAHADTLTVHVGTTEVRNVTADNGAGADQLDDPPAPVISYGGGSLGGSVTDVAAGSSVALAGGTLTIDGGGTLTIAGPTVVGAYEVTYRVKLGNRTSDATVGILVKP
jgi:hypothetical protein